VIKRATIPLSSYSTTVEVRLKQFSVVILPASRLYVGSEQLLGLDTEFKVLISKRCKYIDLKKRLADCINAQRERFQIGAPITEADIRLWKFSDTKEKLVD